MKKMIRRFVAMIFALLMLFQLRVFALPSNYMIGTSTERSGEQAIWVPSGYPDVDPEHWFYSQLQQYRVEGIVLGDEYNYAHLDAAITE